MKRKSLKSAVVAGLTFQGETVAAAKAVGEVEVEKLAWEANIGPSLYHVHNMSVLVWRTLESWNYRILDTYKGNGVVSASCVFTANDRDHAASQAVYACAQYQWNPEWLEHSDEDYIIECFRCMPNTRAVETQRVQLTEWCAWQRRYQALYALTGDRSMSHDIASRYTTKESALQRARKEMGLPEPAEA